LRTFSQDPELARALLFQFGDLGMPVDDLSFLLWSALHQHYFKGSFFPRGNTASIVKKLTRTIYTHGGQVLTSANVQKVTVDWLNRARGVEVEGGIKIKAAVVISTVGVIGTYECLLDKKYQGRL